MSRARFRPARVSRAAAWLLLAALVLPAGGCGGCGSGTTTAQQAAAKKKKEEQEKREREKRKKKKEDFEVGRMLTQPNSVELVESTVKPGHWTSATFEVTAHNFDFHGELQTDPFDLPDMPFRMGTSRPVALPKGQKKHLEATFYLPPGTLGSKIPMRLLGAGGGREVKSETFVTTRMPTHQFYLFVFARDPDRYLFLKEGKLAAINPPQGEFMDDEDTTKAYYRIANPHIDKRTPLATNALTWTTIAYLLWDNMQPSELTPEQQQALLDWLHWGGQVIVSGPGSLEKLKGSFLDPYLPAAGGEAIKLAAPEFAQLNAQFSYGGLPLEPAKAWTGQKLLIDPDTPGVQVLLETPQGEPLVVERRVGRGSIVVSAFRLSQNELKTWYNFDEFLNACLLRHGPRRFASTNEAGITTGTVVDWEGAPGARFDPRRVSGVRYFSRDGGTQISGALRGQILAGSVTARPVQQPMATGVTLDDLQSAILGQPSEEEARVEAGVAGWNDFNIPAEAARASLREAAGIKIPSPRFVLTVLGAYLAVLVPLNWLVFRLLGRVELAWVAAPLVTLAFAVGVVRMARLDIGFTRVRTELAVLECHRGYDRAHATRYTALYTSLSTTYDFHYDDASALVQPFPPFSQNTPEQVELLRQQRRTTVHFRRHSTGGAEGESHITLEGFEVGSNSLGMLHSEHMLDVGGPLALSGSAAEGWKLTNDSDLALQAGAVVEATGTTDAAHQPIYRVAWVPSLAPGAGSDLSFQELPRPDAWEGLARIARGAPLDVAAALRLGLEDLEPGEKRLLAWSADEVPGLRISPSASQSLTATVVVAHLEFAPRPAPQVDVVRLHDVRKADERLPEPQPEEPEEAATGA
jgi:hypothetical protein